MAKRNYLMQLSNGATKIIEAASLTAALNKFKKSPGPAEIEVIGITAITGSVLRRAKIANAGASSSGSYVFTSAAGYEVSAPTLDGFNAVLNRLGYKSVKITRNMLNPAFGEFLIDADTPSYCDPGCESYHSM